MKRAGARRRVLSTFGIVATLVSGVRLLVLFLESVAIVNGERESDAQLVDLCRAGSASASPLMRSACLKAQAERASPLLAKAALRAASVLFAEFKGQVSSSTGLVVAVLFMLSSLLSSLPWIRYLASLTHVEEEEEGDPDQRHIVVLGGPMQRPSLRRRAQRLFLKAPPMLYEDEQC